jgi:acetyltransferase-like isoleucine patch superfamily enzyme
VRKVWATAGRVGSIGPGSAAGRRFGAFGDSSIICFPQGPMFNERYVHIGHGTLIGAGVALSAGMAPGQECLTNPVVRIGDRCLIGRNSSIVGHLRIDIGDDVWTGPNVYITDQNHGYEDIDQPISRQTQPEREVVIGDGCWLGTNTVVLPGARIGRHVTVGAGSVIGGVLPDFSVAVGSPARVVRFHDGTAWVRPAPAPDQPQPLPSSPGGAHLGMPFADVKSVTTLLTGPPAASDSR